MFDFGVYITLLITIAVFCISSLISLYNDRDKLNMNIDNISTDLFKNNIRKRRENIDSSISNVKTWSFLFGLFVSFLFFFYDIKYFFVNIIFPIFKKIVSISYSLILNLKFILPFENGFFLDKNFKFSYLTEVFFAVLIVLTIMCILLNDSIELWNIIVSLFISISIFIGLLWLNVFISNYLCSHLSKKFEMKSLIINIIIYLIILLLVFLISMFLIFLFKKTCRKKTTKIRAKTCYDEFVRCFKK